MVAGNDEPLWVEARTGKTVLECRDVPTAVAWSPTANTCHGRLSGWLPCAMRKPRGAQLARAQGECHPIVFSADNQYLATGSGDDTAKVWSVKAAAIAHRLSRAMSTT